MADTAGGLPRVDFYHLDNDKPHSTRLFCCRLSDKAWSLGNRILILCQDNRECQLLDQLMWTWRDDSFLPHSLAGTDEAEHSPIVISDSLPAGSRFDLIINLDTDLPCRNESIASCTHRIAEIINQNPKLKQQGRLRYSYYDKYNYPLEYHEITTG